MKKSPQQYIVNFLTSDADDIWSTIEIREKEGISATGALIAILQDTGDTASDKRAHQFKRIKAAYGLGKLRDPRSIPVLIDALREHDESLSLVASSALVAIGSEAVEPLISALLLYLDRHFRFFAIDTLKQLGDKRAVEPLIALLQDTEVSGQAAIALGSLGDPNAAISLIDAIDKHEQSSCRPFVIALGMIGEPLAIKSLVKCLIDYPDHVSLGAAEA